jgi:O-antigen/teichoic acid export membrane protein
VSFFRNVGTVLASSVAVIPVSLAISIVLARFLSVPDRGLYGLLTNFSLLLFLFAQLGWPDAVIYRVRRAGVAPRRAFATGLLASSALGGLAAGLCLVFGEPLRHAFMRDAQESSFVIAAVTAPLLVAGELLRGVARAVDRFDLHNQFGLLQVGGLYLALCLALPVMGGALDAALLANLVVQLLLVAYLCARLAAQLGFEPSVSPGEALASVGYGWKLYVQNLLMNLHERLDLLLLPALGTAAADIAQYAVAVTVVSQLRLVPGALTTVLLPQLAGASRADAAEFTAAVARRATALMAAAALALVPIGIVGIPLLFGASYRPAVTPFLWLLPGVAAVTSSRVLSRYFAAVDEQRAVLAVRCGALALNFALNCAFIPSHGVIGAAWASLASYSAEALAIAWLFLATTGRGPRDVFWPRAGDFAPLRARLRDYLARRT